MAKRFILIIICVVYSLTTYSQNNDLNKPVITGTSVLPLHTFYIKYNKPHLKGVRTFISQMKLNIGEEKTDTVYQIEFRWSRNSSAVVPMNKLEIEQLNAGIDRLNEIDLTNATNGTNYKYTLPNRMVIAVEKNSKGKKQFYFVIPAAGGNNPNYYDYDTLLKIFRPIKDYIQLGTTEAWPTEIIIQ